MYRTIRRSIDMLAATVSLGLVSFAGDALANEASGQTINAISTDSRLMIWTSSGIYYATFNGGITGCPNVSADTWKSWLALAQAAKLSGHTLDIGYTPAGACPVNYIAYIKLN